MELRKFRLEALPRPLKKYIKSIIPDSIISWRRKRILNSFIGRSNSEIFTSTYLNYLWGRKEGDFNFYSGDGSHDPKIVEDYVIKVSDFLAQISPRPVVVDIGCGDFQIGNQLARFARNYIACDVVPEVIKANKHRYRQSNVNFRVLDATSEEIPSGDVAILRQVLQHLSNFDIHKVLERLYGNFRYLIFTDHHPSELIWTPNLDKQTGPNIRTEFGSGLNLTEPPFNLRTKGFKLLSEVEVDDGFIRTFLFHLE